jgi:hypothetical protein
MRKFTAREYLAIDIANNFGLDKINWEDRLQWFEENQNNLMQLVPSAKEPALFYAGIKALESVNMGQPIGYPISLDATSSGLQFLAVLTGDGEAAKICNVVGEHRKDAYTLVYERMLAIMGESAKITRDMVKDAVMTSLYGSQAIPKEVFGEGLLLKVFYTVMKASAPAAWELNEVFLNIWDASVSSHDWVLPDNFHVHVKVMRQEAERIHFRNQPIDVYYKVNAPIENGRSLGANCIHSIDAMVVREITRRCDYQPQKVKKIQKIIFTAWDTPQEYEDTSDNRMVLTLWDHYKETGYLSARILDHITEENITMIDRSVIQELLDSLPVKPFKVISIHDSFRVLPQYGNDLREQYNRQLMLLAKSTLLQNLLSQIIGKQVTIGKLDSHLWKDIMASEYALS